MRRSFGDLVPRLADGFRVEQSPAGDLLFRADQPLARLNAFASYLLLKTDGQRSLRQIAASVIDDYERAGKPIAFDDVGRWLASLCWSAGDALTFSSTA